MSILVNKNTRVIFQGITGKLGQYYSLQMIEYGTQVVAGVTPGKKGQVVNGVPVYNTIKEAKEKHGADCVMVFVPAPFTKDAFMECIDAEVDLILCLTEGVPVQDMMVTRTKLNEEPHETPGSQQPRDCDSRRIHFRVDAQRGVCPQGTSVLSPGAEP